MSLVVSLDHMHDLKRLISIKKLPIMATYLTQKPKLLSGGLGLKFFQYYASWVTLHFLSR